MSAFATAEDLQSRWRPLTAAEKQQANVLLEDASAILTAECPGIGGVAAAVPLVKRVVCSMVQRAMAGGSGGAFPAGVTQVSQTAGPFSGSFTFANPNGDLYLLESERRALRGLQGGGQVFTVSLGRGE